MNSLSPTIRYFRIALCAVLLSAVARAPLAAAPMEREISMQAAMELALQHSPVLAKARSAIQEKTGVRIEARAAMLPTLDGVARYAAQDGGRLESFGPTITPLDQSWLAEIGIKYVLYNGGGRLAGVKAADSSVKAAEDSLRAAVNDVLLEVAKAYFDALLARDKIAVQEEAQKLLGEQLDNAKKRFDAGTGQQFAVLQAEVSLANARPALISAKSSYKLAIERLRTAAGVDYPEGMDGGDVRLAGAWPSAGPAVSLDAALRTAAAKRPELAAAQAATDIARQALVAEIAKTRPQVAATAGYGLEGRRFADDFLEDPLRGWTAGMEVRIPIVDVGQARGRKLQAEARVEASLSQARATELGVQAEVRAAWLAVEEAREILETSSLVVKQADEALRLARAGFDAGASTQLEVLESRFALTQSRLSEITATHQYHTALASLRRASGEAP